MEGKEYEGTEKIDISNGVERKKSVQVPPRMLDRWDEMADKMDISRSELVRLLTTVGMNTLDQYDPTSETEQSNQDNPLNEVILDHLDVGEKNAKSVEEIADDVADSVLEQALELLFETDNVCETKNQFYKV